MIERSDHLDLPNEKWRKIPTFAERYEVSNMGRLRTNEYVANCKNGKTSRRKAKMLYGSYSSIRKYKLDRYLMTTLKTIEGRRMTTYIHRLVALAFVENPLNKPHVNHKDGNTLNNLPINLEWVTNRENIQHAHDNGLINTPVGEKANKAKLTNAQVIEIMNTEGKPIDIAKKYGVSNGLISSIKTGRYWGAITGKIFQPTNRQKRHDKN
jgi:hypothetical protein